MKGDGKKMAKVTRLSGRDRIVVVDSLGEGKLARVR